MKIEIFHKSNRLAVIEYNKIDIVCHRDDKDSPFQPFFCDNITENDLICFLKSRVFDNARPDAKDLLKTIGLSSYNPVEIAKKTHGILMSDYVWLKFDDEPFTWEKANKLILIGK